MVDQSKYHRFTGTIIHLVICLFALTTTSYAERRIVPAFERSIEMVLLGPQVEPKPIGKSGRWKVKNQRLVPPQGPSHFVVGHIEDGTTRLRFNKGELRTRIIFGAKLTPNGSDLRSGYALRFDGAYMWLEHIRDGRLKVISAKTKLWRFWRAKKVELILTLINGDLSVQVYDRDDEERPGALYATGLSNTFGSVGFWNRKGDIAPLEVQLISYRPRCSQIPANKRGHSMVVRAHSRDDQPMPEKMVLVDRIDSDEPCPTMENVCRPTLVFRTDPLGFERLVCANFEIVDFIPKPPWRYLSDAFREQAGEVHKSKNPKLSDMVFPTPKQVVELLHDWHNLYPDQTRLHRLGTSRQNRPIYAIAIGRDAGRTNQRPNLLFNAAHHGDEAFTTLIALDIIGTLLTTDEPSTIRMLEHFVTWVVPMVNPDGVHNFQEVSTGWGRKNAAQSPLVRNTQDHGVDLNRNYPFRWGNLGEKGSRSQRSSRHYRGPQPASEPETRAMMALARKVPFLASISYHTGTIALLAPYTIDGVKNPEIDEAWPISQAMIQMLPKVVQNRRFKVKRKLYSVDGVDQDWHRFEHGTLALLLEAARFAPRRLDERKALIESLRPSWRFLASRFLSGPAISIRVLDNDGRPLSTEVSIDRMQPPNGEVWKSRCPGGIYRRYLPKPGSYTLRVQGLGEKIKKRITVTDELKEIEIRLSEAWPKARCKTQ